MQTREMIKQLDEAFAQRATGDYAGALRELERLERLSRNPQDIAALRFFQVTCLTDLGRAEEALKRISKVDKSQLIFSKQVDYEYERARIERALGHADEALHITEKAVRIARSATGKDEMRTVSEGLRTLWGILLAEVGRCHEALPVLEAVTTDDKGWAESRLLLGDCSYRGRRYREAIAYYLSLASSDKASHVIKEEAAKYGGFSRGADSVQ